jgi:hypothetical protein
MIYRVWQDFKIENMYAHILQLQELFTRLVVLLHNPLAKEQLASQILTVSLRQ